MPRSTSSTGSAPSAAVNAGPRWSSSAATEELLERPDLGRIAPGAAEDLVAVAGDLFADITSTGRVESVMSAGAVTLDRTGGR